MLQVFLNEKWLLKQIMSVLEVLMNEIRKTDIAFGFFKEENAMQGVVRQSESESGGFVTEVQDESLEGYEDESSVKESETPDTATILRYDSRQAVNQIRVSRKQEEKARYENYELNQLKSFLRDLYKYPQGKDGFTQFGRVMSNLESIFLLAIVLGVGRLIKQPF